MNSNIKVIIWDFDGTFYRPIPELWHTIREAEYRVIMEANGWDHEKAATQFNTLYKKVTPSATQTVGRLSDMTTTAAALKMEDFYDRRDFVKPDPKLVSMFANLTSYRHFMLANGVRKRIIETIEHLGLPHGTFEEIVTSELSGENKPSPAGFLYILNKTKLPPGEHLMIGDREQVDLEPAKKLGMKTCFVGWGEKPSGTHDASVGPVYDVTKLLQ